MKRHCRVSRRSRALLAEYRKGLLRGGERENTGYEEEIFTNISTREKLGNGVPMKGKRSKGWIGRKNPRKVQISEKRKNITGLRNPGRNFE